jgi:hypothetical protein
LNRKIFSRELSLSNLDKFKNEKKDNDDKPSGKYMKNKNIFDLFTPE